jgi:hypothetical protein
MPQIALEWDAVKRAYPMRPLSGALKTFMDSIPGTPCCVQMSHALSVAGAEIPGRSHRRATSRIASEEGTFFYLLAVDEMTWFLHGLAGPGEDISADENGQRRTAEDMKAVLQGRTGILVFSDLQYGMHTELWDVDHLHQRDISAAVFNQPRVLFWDVMVTAAA